MKTLFFLLSSFCLIFSAFSAEPPKKKICLNMIVKNESKVITRCLKSVMPIIDYWVIVDTGSTDGTQAIIKEYMKNVPGELYETPWINFEHNRNDALEKAKGKADYLLIIDADEILSFDPDFKMPYLDKDFYYIVTSYGGSEYVRTQLINARLNWKWIGVVHEALDTPDAKTSDKLLGVKNVVHTDGARSKDPLKFHKDAAMIQEALDKDPTNTRYMFYLAQSWKDAGEHAKSIEFYKKRVAMGGWDEEVFWSKLQIAHLQKALDMPPETFLASYYDAYHFRNTRAEPLYYIANYYRLKGNYALGLEIANTANSIPPNKDILFIEKWIYDYGIDLEESICAYWTGRYKECKNLSLKILSKKDLPENVRECVERNLSFTRAKLLNLYDPAFNPA